MARAFLAEGMKVALADWNDKHIAKATRTARRQQCAHFIKCNVADRDTLRAAARRDARRRSAQIHVLRNNAGVNGGGDRRVSEDFDDLGPGAGSQPWRGDQRHQDHRPDSSTRSARAGHVVNTSSMAGVVPLPGLAAYSTAEVCGARILREPADAAGTKGIGVSCLFPGATRTALVPLPEDDPASIKEEGAPAVPQGLVGRDARGDRPARNGSTVVEAIKANRFYIFTNEEFLDEVKQRHREIEDSFPAPRRPAGRVKFEMMRADMVRNLMAPGNRSVPTEDEDFALDLGSQSPAGGQ